MINFGVVLIFVVNLAAILREPCMQIFALFRGTANRLFAQLHRNCGSDVGRSKHWCCVECHVSRFWCNSE